VVATSKTGFLTKTHVKFLESIGIDAATKANRYRLENSKAWTTPDSGGFPVSFIRPAK
jgi:hypothetical protein